MSNKHGVFLGQRVASQTEDYMRLRMVDEDSTSPLLTPQLNALTEKYCETISDVTPEGGEVIEIGIGTGASIVQLMQSRLDIKVTGVDINIQRLERAAFRLRAYGGRLTLVEQDAAEYLNGREDKGKLGTIATANTLHNLTFEERVPILKAAADSLQPGGHFIDFDKHEADDEHIAQGDFADRLHRFAHLFGAQDRELKAWTEHFTADHEKDQPRGEYLEYLHSIGYSATTLVMESGLEVIVKARK